MSNSDVQFYFLISAVLGFFVGIVVVRIGTQSSLIAKQNNAIIFFLSKISEKNGVDRKEIDQIFDFYGFRKQPKIKKEM